MSKSIIYKTTPEQKLRIKEGREQIARGEYFTNEQVELSKGFKFLPKKWDSRNK